MTTIGVFKQNADGSFTGSINTLSMNLRNVVFKPVAKSEEKAPDFRVLVGAVEFGAAWRRVSKENHGHLSVKLDDPTFPAPIYASLITTHEGFRLVWSRPRAD